MFVELGHSPTTRGSNLDFLILWLCLGSHRFSVFCQRYSSDGKETAEKRSDVRLHWPPGRGVRWTEWV